MIFIDCFLTSFHSNLRALQIPIPLIYRVFYFRLPILFVTPFK